MGRILALVLTFIALIVFLFWITQRRMIYLPSGDVPLPDAVGLPGTQTVAFPTEDGLTLHGWFVPARAPATGDTVIVFNGNAGNRAYRAELARGLADRGIAVLLFDYRGYGGNPGSPSEAGLGRDARAARQFVESRRDVDSRRVTYFGESLGAGVAVGLAVELPPRALILRSPWTSLADAGGYHFPYLPVSWLLRDRFPSLERIGRIRVPLLVIAAAHDSIVPTSQSRRLFEAANEPKKLLIVNAADHNDLELLAGPAVLGTVNEFLRALP
jgi:uncharacterized protein